MLIYRGKYDDYFEPRDNKLLKRMEAKKRRRHIQHLRSEARQKRYRVIERYGKLCVYCLERVADTIDHVIPLSKGGDSSIENLRPACSDCNEKKGNTEDFNY